MAAENKTKPTKASAKAFIDAVANAERRADAHALLKLFQEATGEKAVMWGPSIVGFGQCRYKYESGREGDMCLVGFSPRSTALVLYGLSGFPGAAALKKRLGKFTGGKSCLYVKRLADIDLGVLEAMIAKAAAHTAATRAG